MKISCHNNLFLWIVRLLQTERAASKGNCGKGESCLMWANPMCKLSVFILFSKTVSFTLLCSCSSHPERISISFFCVQSYLPSTKSALALRLSQSQFPLASIAIVIDLWNIVKKSKLATGLSFVSVFCNERHAKITVQVCLQPQRQMGSCHE